MKIGKAGLDIIKVYEQGPDGGPAFEAYLCPARVWTLGWGHTKGVRMASTRPSLSASSGSARTARRPRRQSMTW